MDDWEIEELEAEGPEVEGPKVKDLKVGTPEFEAPEVEESRFQRRDPRVTLLQPREDLMARRLNRFGRMIFARRTSNTKHTSHDAVIDTIVNTHGYKHAAVRVATLIPAHSGLCVYIFKRRAMKADKICEQGWKDQARIPVTQIRSGRMSRGLWSRIGIQENRT